MNVLRMNYEDYLVFFFHFPCLINSLVNLTPEHFLYFHLLKNLPTEVQGTILHQLVPLPEALASVNTTLTDLTS